MPVPKKVARRTHMQAGFLAKEKPAKPISAAALEALFEEKLAKAAALRAVLDPEEQPYLSRYEERNLLAELAAQAAANEAAEPEGSAAARRPTTTRCTSSLWRRATSTSASSRS